MMLGAGPAQAGPLSLMDRPGNLRIRLRMARHSNGLVVFFCGKPKGLNIDIHTYNHIHVYDYMILYDCICIIQFGDGL